MKFESKNAGCRGVHQAYVGSKIRVRVQVLVLVLDEYRPDYRALLQIRMAQAVMGSLEGEAGATYHRLLEEHHQHVASLVQARRDP